ncbi:MAG: phage holin family protein [Candidatus Wildermuthbacteria bacterium]|nr:phage holin family protein [Candidatus Wildermuthbacteria bacterium]
MLQTLVVSLVAGLGGLWIASRFVPGVQLSGSLQDLLIPGVILAILIAAIKPLLGITTIVVKSIVLGVVVGGAIWALPLLFPNIVFSGPVPALWTAGIIASIVLAASLWKK